MRAHIDPNAVVFAVRTNDTVRAAEKFESEQVATIDRRRILGVDGVHDLGGVDGFGPVEHEVAEPVFAEDWERRVFRLMIGSLGSLAINGRMFRHSIERMDPAHYLSSPYFEHWLTGVTTLAVEAGAGHDRRTRAPRRRPFSAVPARPRRASR